MTCNALHCRPAQKLRQRRSIPAGRAKGPMGPRSHATPVRCCARSREQVLKKEDSYVEMPCLEASLPPSW